MTPSSLSLVHVFRICLHDGVAEWVRGASHAEVRSGWLSEHDRYLGVTPPISTSESNPREKEVTVTLMEELRRQGIFESEEESKRR